MTGEVRSQPTFSKRLARRVSDLAEAPAFLLAPGSRAHGGDGNLQRERPGEGTMAIAIAQAVIWEATTTLPAMEGRSFNVTWTATRDMPAGTAVWFHVGNHGQNSWRFADFVIREQKH
jgi:hypothetical protein